MFELKAQPREILGKKVKKLRKTGLIPAVLYGHGLKSLSLAVEAKAFSRALGQVGESSILPLVIGGKKHNVLIHDLAYHPLTGEILHIDFYEVKMDEKIKTKISLVFGGEAPAVKSEGGVLIRPIQEIEVEAFPRDLVKEIPVDISSLATFEDKIHIKDLKISGQIKVLADPEEIVALVVPPRSEKELEELATKPMEAVEEVEVVGEQKPEEEVSASAVSSEEKKAKREAKP